VSRPADGNTGEGKKEKKKGLNKVRGITHVADVN